MKKVSGKVQYRELATGVWVLEGDDGKTYELAGGNRKIKKVGQRIEAEGEIAADGVSIGMSGPLFRVSRYKVI